MLGYQMSSVEVTCLVRSSSTVRHYTIDTKGDQHDLRDAGKDTALTSRASASAVYKIGPSCCIAFASATRQRLGPASSMYVMYRRGRGYTGPLPQLQGLRLNDVRLSFQPRGVSLWA